MHGKRTSRSYGSAKHKKFWQVLAPSDNIFQEKDEVICNIQMKLKTLKAWPRFAGVSPPTIVASVRSDTVCITLTAFKGNL